VLVVLGILRHCNQFFVRHWSWSWFSLFFHYSVKTVTIVGVFYNPDGTIGFMEGILSNNAMPITVLFLRMVIPSVRVLDGVFKFVLCRAGFFFVLSLVRVERTCTDCSHQESYDHKLKKVKNQIFKISLQISHSL